jgi:predicted nucleic acid-binding Zn ribbon protein
MVVIRTLTEKERTPVCPNDGASLVREYAPPALTFKGKGWGKDD